MEVGEATRLKRPRTSPQMGTSRRARPDNAFNRSHTQPAHGTFKWTRPSHP